jgi:hypothetical protein
MQDLDNFILPILGFEGDIPIPVILISAHVPGAESSEDPTAIPSASASRTRACKRKAPIDSSPPKRPRRLPEKLRVRSRSPALNKKLLLQLLHREFRKGSQSSDQKGILILSTLFYCLLLSCKLPCRVPQDIPLASPTKNIPHKSRSPKVDKPPSPCVGKTLLEMLNPADSEDINVPTGATRNLTSPLATDSRRDTTHQSPRPDSTVHQEASPISPKSFGLGAHGGPQQGEGSPVPRPEKQPRQYSRLVETLWDNLDFIQVGFHIGRYVSTSMNTQAEQEQIKALYSSMKTTSKLIDISFYAPTYLLNLRPNSSLIQAVVKHC